MLWSISMEEMDRVSGRIRATFVMEQHLGHSTYYQNVQRFVDAATDIQATWVLVTYTHPGGLWERLTFLPARIRGTLRGRAQVRRGLSQTTSDVVFFNTQVPAALGGWLTRRQPYVISTDLTPIQYDQLSRLYGHQPDRPGLLKTYKYRVNKALLCGASRLLPWSTWARNSLIADYGVDPQKIEVLPPGVDLTLWTPRTKQAEGRLRILFVGGDLHRKGGDVLLRAFRALPRDTAELILVTRSQTPREDGIVSYHDLQPNAPELIALFQTCDVFVLPTEAEAFGIAAVEASAVGLPIIANAIGGLPDIVVDGETGFLLQSGDVRVLRDHLQLLAEDAGLRERMGRAARHRAETHFDARRNAERLVGYLLEAARATNET
jgi:glycosyltransferase involved in cell wall biosynthesis